MCGRFTLYIPRETLAKTFQLTEVPEYQPSYNIAPTDTVPVIGQNAESGDRSASLLRWGLVPHWVDDPEDFSAQLINARLETADEKSSFRGPFRRRRCVVPANGFYEWKQTPEGKIPHYVHPTNEDCFRFAGLWDLWTNNEADETISSFTILTTEPTSKLRELHDRMPVILDQDRMDAWLDPGNENVKELKTLAKKSVSNDTLTFHPVSKAVNNPSYDKKDCTEPVES